MQIQVDNIPQLILQIALGMGVLYMIWQFIKWFVDTIIGGFFHKIFDWVKNIRNR